MATTSPRKAAGRTTGASKPAAGKTAKTATGKTAGKAASGATARATVRAPGSEKSPQRPATAATGTGKNAASRGNGAGKSAKSTGATAPTGTKANDVAYWDAVAALNTPTELDGAPTPRRDAFLQDAMIRLAR